MAGETAEVGMEGYPPDVKVTTDRKLTEEDHKELFARDLHKEQHPEHDWWNDLDDDGRMYWREMAKQRWPIVRAQKMPK